MRAGSEVKKMGRFTLIEMLVVIAIIAIVSSLLMPALRSSIDSAKGLQCMNNQRQVAVAQIAYGENNAGWIFCGWLEAGYYWMTAAYGEKLGSYDFGSNYLDDKNAGLCQEQYPYTYSSSWKSSIGFCYGFNKSFYTYAKRKKAVNVPAAGTNLFFFNLYGVSSPNKPIWFADSVISGDAWQGTYGSDRPQSSQWDMLSWSNPVFKRGIHLRHLNNANTAYADGHIESSGIESLVNKNVKSMVMSNFDELTF